MRILWLVLLFYQNIFCQSALEVFGGKSFLMHNSDFQRVNNLPNCCFLFKSGSGEGENLGMGVNLKYSSNDIIKIVISLNNSRLTFKESQKDYFNLNGNVIQGSYSHHVEFNYSSFALGVYYGYELNKQLTVLLGMNLGMTNNVKLKQYEKIEEPNNQAVFVDTQTRIRNSFESSLANHLSYGLSPGLEYKMPLNKKENFFISGTLYFKIDINSTFQEIKSTENSLKAQFKLIYLLPN